MIKKNGWFKKLKAFIGRLFFPAIVQSDTTKYVSISDARIAELTKKALDAGARIHVLRRVRIQEDLDWQQAINLAGSNTPNNSIRQSEVSEQYQSVSNQVVEKDMVLFGCSAEDNTNWHKATTWGDANKLKRANPREGFAVAEQHPTLDKTLGQDEMYLVAPTEGYLKGSGSFGCSIWWLRSDPEVHLYWSLGFYSGNVWFAFCDE